MRIAIFCEYSGVVREAFRKQGHEVWSFDLLPSDDKSPFHIQGDCRPYLDGYWDIAICHPPCTFLSLSGVRWLKNNDQRWIDLYEACKFFKLFVDAPIKMKCIENPVQHAYNFGMIPKYNQIVHPHMFGHVERKQTCLWLTGLPKLIATADVKHLLEWLPRNQTDKIHYAVPGADRSKLRSKTYQGVADAFATQWGNQ